MGAIEDYEIYKALKTCSNYILNDLISALYNTATKNHVQSRCMVMFAHTYYTIRCAPFD